MVNLRLRRQCEQHNLRLVPLKVVRAAEAGLWRDAAGRPQRPEIVALEALSRPGEHGWWCEGGTLNLLMKAAAFPVFVRYNTFGDRGDARTRYLEAQCTILANRRRALLNQVVSASRAKVLTAAAEILEEPFVRGAYPRVTLEGIAALWAALGAERLAEIFEVFLQAPYDYRAGWPDLTLVCGDQLRFAEVKTTDSLHESQFRVIDAFIKPLQLDLAVVHVFPAA